MHCVLHDWVATSQGVCIVFYTAGSPCHMECALFYMAGLPCHRECALCSRRMHIIVLYILFLGKIVLLLSGQFIYIQPHVHEKRSHKDNIKHTNTATLQ